MKKFFKKLLIGGICLLFLSIRFADVRVGAKNIEFPLLSAWQSTGVTAESLTLEMWSEFTEKITDKEELRRLAGAIASKLQLYDLRERALGNSGELLYITVEGLYKDGTVVTLSLQGDGTQLQGGLHLIRGGKCDDLEKYLRNWRKKADFCGFKNSEIILGISGFYNGKFKSQRLQDIGVRVFESLQARITDGMSTANGCSYHGLIQEKPTNEVEFTAVYDELYRRTEVSLQAEI